MSIGIADREFAVTITGSHVDGGGGQEPSGESGGMSGR